jgi:hypothetical protein
VLTLDTERKIEEIKTRRNRRRMLGSSSRASQSVFVYEPYAGLGDALSHARSNTGSVVSIRKSPVRIASSRVSPRKRKVDHDESVIRVDDVDDTVLEQNENRVPREKTVKSWQEALGLPATLEPGWLQDTSASGKERGLLMEIPVASRGRSRNWFKAILPDY